MKKIISVFFLGFIIGACSIYFYMQNKAYKVAVKAFESGLNLRQEIKSGTSQDWKALQYENADSTRRRAIYDSLVAIALTDED